MSLPNLPAGFKVDSEGKRANPLLVIRVTILYYKAMKSIIDYNRLTFGQNQLHVFGIQNITGRG
jgi:hypothetical protein